MSNLADDPQEKPPEDRFARARLWLGRAALYLCISLIGLVLTILGLGSMIPGFVLALGLVGLVAFRRHLRGAFGVAIGLCGLLLIGRALVSPSNDRDWKPHLEILAKTSLKGETLTIDGVRNIRWSEDGKQPETITWEKRDYDLKNLQGMDLIVVPFSYTDLMAHTMISFDFGPQGRLVLSIEARLEDDENYGPIQGGLNSFEVIYLFLDESDAYTGRARTGSRINSYPIKTQPMALRAFFLSLCVQANGLHRDAKFYHILKHNCTTLWIEQADKLSTNIIGIRFESLANGMIGDYLYDKDHVATDLPLEEAKDRFRLDEAVLATPVDAPDFSNRIRADFP